MFDLEDFIYPEVGWPYIASGMGFSPYVHQASWVERNQMVAILKEWEAYVDKLPSMYQFLKNSVYAKAQIIDKFLFFLYNHENCNQN